MVKTVSEQNNDSGTEHTNAEPTVRCPVDGCEKETLSRGLHLHVRQSSGGGHGEQGTVPDDLDLDDAEPVGNRDVEMTYPNERDTESVSRLCPYCERPFKGKHGVMIHLGEMAGRKDHPKRPKDKHDLEDFPIVKVDDDGNIIERVDSGTQMPSTERRIDAGEKAGGLDPAVVEDYIEGLREQGKDEEADRAEQALLDS